LLGTAGISNILSDKEKTGSGKPPGSINSETAHVNSNYMKVIPIDALKK
jgi:hypothetical protein